MFLQMPGGLPLSTTAGAIHASKRSGAIEATPMMRASHHLATPLGIAFCPF